MIGFRDSTPELAGFVWTHGPAQNLTLYVTYKTSHQPPAHLHFLKFRHVSEPRGAVSHYVAYHGIISFISFMPRHSITTTPKYISRLES